MAALILASCFASSATCTVLTAPAVSRRNNYVVSFLLKIGDNRPFSEVLSEVRRLSEDGLEFSETKSPDERRDYGFVLSEGGDPTTQRIVQLWMQTEEAAAKLRTASQNATLPVCRA